MNEIAKYLTDDSQICYQDGTKITGAKDVAESIIKNCESYNKGYMEAFTREVGKGVIIGTAIICGSIGVSIIVKMKRKKKLNEEERA